MLSLYKKLILLVRLMRGPSLRHTRTLIGPFGLYTRIDSHSQFCAPPNAFLELKRRKLTPVLPQYWLFLEILAMGFAGFCLSGSTAQVFSLGGELATFHRYQRTVERLPHQ